MEWTAADIPSQEGRIALRLGPTSAWDMSRPRLSCGGATVLMACRSRRKAKTRSALLEEGLTGLDLIDLDLADLDDVATAADTVQQRYGQLDLLINNAGHGAPYQRSRQGHELQFAVNHLGHMALTQGFTLLKQDDRW